MSGADDLDRMSPDEIRAWAERKWAESREAHAGEPLPEISRVKRDDYPHWEVVAYEFHTSSGKRVLIDQGDGRQVEGTLRGVRPAARGQDVLLVETDGLWGCLRADGSDWAPARNGRVRVETLRVPVLARRLDPGGTAQGDEDVRSWTLQTNMEGQP